MASFNLFVGFAIIAAAVECAVQAYTQQEYDAWKAKVGPAFSECANEFKLDEATVKDAKENGKVDNIDPCFFACVYKKRGLMTDGKIDTDKCIAGVKQILKNEEEVKNAIEALNDCKSVNSEPGEDCARGKAFATCLLKYRSKFTLS